MTRLDSYRQAQRIDAQIDAPINQLDVSGGVVVGGLLLLFLSAILCGVCGAK